MLTLVFAGHNVRVDVVLRLLHEQAQRLQSLRRADGLRREGTHGRQQARIRRYSPRTGPLLAVVVREESCDHTAKHVRNRRV